MSCEGDHHWWSTELDAEEGELNAVRPPNREPTARPREAGEKKGTG